PARRCAPADRPAAPGVTRPRSLGEPWVVPALAGSELPADLAVRVLRGVDVDVQVVLLESRHERVRDRHGSLDWAVARAAQRDDDWARNAHAAHVDVRGRGLTGELREGQGERQLRAGQRPLEQAVSRRVLHDLLGYLLP